MRRRELTILANRALRPTDAGGVDQDAKWTEFSCLSGGDVDGDKRAADVFGKFCPAVRL